VQKSAKLLAYLLRSTRRTLELIRILLYLCSGVYPIKNTPQRQTTLQLVQRQRHDCSQRHAEEDDENVVCHSQAIIHRDVHDGETHVQPPVGGLKHLTEKLSESVANYARGQRASVTE
jgi:hypothetical protein